MCEIDGRQRTHMLLHTSKLQYNEYLHAFLIRLDGATCLNGLYFLRSENKQKLY